MIDIQEFLSKDKSMIIAPAGYGKTHTIVDCIEQYEGEKKILVLTHTHAGVASIKEKIKRKDIPHSKYQIETISSFAVNIANVYHLNKAIFPPIEDSKLYFRFVIDSTLKFVQNNAVKSVLRSKYSHLIVDEYQDCSTEQHNLILKLSLILKTHILGDPLQGIFNFRNIELVDLETEFTLNDYRENTQELTTPWRWNNHNASDLGNELADIRRKLIAGESIDLNNYNSVEVVTAPSLDLYRPRTAYKDRIWQEIKNSGDNLLIIHPLSSSEAPRLKFLQYFPLIKMIESLDNELVYNHCKELDNKMEVELPTFIIYFISNFSSGTNIKKWIKTTNAGWRCVNKTLESEKIFSRKIKDTATKLTEKKSSANIIEFLTVLLEIPGINCTRKGIIYEIIAALKVAQLSDISIYEAMKQNMDKIRREGRKIKGKCIGTTLLTKGLECDTVIILDAHRFTDRKNLYVALTRACKKLVVITENAILQPY